MRKSLTSFKARIESVWNIINRSFNEKDFCPSSKKTKNLDLFHLHSRRSPFKCFPNTANMCGSMNVYVSRIKQAQEHNDSNLNSSLYLFDTTLFHLGFIYFSIVFIVRLALVYSAWCDTVRQKRTQSTMHI